MSIVNHPISTMMTAEGLFRVNEWTITWIFPVMYSLYPPFNNDPKLHKKEKDIHTRAGVAVQTRNILTIDGSLGSISSRLFLHPYDSTLVCA
jgi:hypothetical protein